MESCAVPGADARIWRVVEVRQRENDRADAQNRPEYADRKSGSRILPTGPNVHFLSSFAQGASGFSTLFAYGSSPIASEFLTVPVPFGLLVPNFLSSVYLYRIFLDRFS
jgi:hypothetical protein